MLPPSGRCSRGTTGRRGSVPRSREGPGCGRRDDVNGAMVDIGPAGEIDALLAAPRREIDSNCLDPVRQPRGPRQAIRQVVDSGGSPLQGGTDGIL
jgi:hypothetical protein